MLGLRRDSNPTRSRHPAAWTVATLLTLVLACDKKGGGSSDPDQEEGGELGYTDASSEDLAPLPPALREDDAEGNLARSEVLWKMQRAMRVAERVFAANVGVTTTRFVAIAKIDGGGASGEVAFWRWADEVLADGEATAKEAERWLLVPITFDPDTSLEPQMPKGGPDRENERVLEAMLFATATLGVELPAARFDIYAFREQGETEKVRQTRLYMMGSNNESPDIELVVVDAAKRNKPPTLGSRKMHLDAGKASALPLASGVTPLGPTTIMRARAIANATGNATGIVDGAGNEWHFDPTTSTVVAGPAPKPSKKKKK